MLHRISEDDDIDQDDLEQGHLETLRGAPPLPPESELLPEALHIFPLTVRPLFPGMASPLLIESGPYYDTLKNLVNDQCKFIGLVLTKQPETDLSKLSFDNLHRIGVLARILRVIPMESGGAQLVLNIEMRIRIDRQLHSGKKLYAKVSYHDDEQHFDAEDKAYAMAIISTMKELLKHSPLFKDEMQHFISHSDFTEPGKLADFASSLTTASRAELQEVLETIPIQRRVDKVMLLLKKELDLCKFQGTISQKIEVALNKNQREFYLREQLKTIKRELGIDKDDKSSDREKFEGRLKNKTVPEEIQKVLNEELEKHSQLEPQSPEYALSRNYLDWLSAIPWGIKSPDLHTLAEAETILEHDHYGLADVKQRILEFIAVAKQSGGLKGSIICLVGPPGVGKTSVGKSVAKALNRKFFRFSVGGMRDEAEIKGHRRTYLGAMPGKIIQALKYCQAMNPVIMLDEVDKLVASYHGDPASALLEVLDPEQNFEFLDHYLDVRCDLSNVLFIATANMIDTIPEALLDRMDVIRLSGYILEEKLAIAKRYLIPKHLKQMGLHATQVSFTMPTLKQLVNDYAREAGVRTLENNVKKILRKYTLSLVRRAEKQARPRPSKQRIMPKDLEHYLGKPLFHSDRLYAHTPVGVCMGLAWTSHGGATLYVEAIRVPGEKTEMKLTGQAGQVMKESCEIAWSYLHGMVEKYAPGHAFFEKSQVHIHIPEGATPKDGPSAGITMVTSILSLLTRTPITDDLGMTGEITLTGRILPVGGIKEKLVAAKRSGLKQVIFPKENQRDLDELAEYIKRGITIHYADHYDQVFALAFPNKSLAS